MAALATPLVAPPPSTLFASVDMGTNSFKLLIVTANPAGKFITLHRHKEPVLLGLNSTATLSTQTQQRAFGALAKFTDMLCAHKVDRVNTRFVATSAVREAGNRVEFCENVKGFIGFDVDVLSGEEEAKYVYMGVLQFLPVFGKLVLCVDIGGGSTEFVIGKEGRVLFGKSVKLGHVTLSRMFGRNGEVDVGGLREYVRRVIAQSGVIEGVREFGYEVAVGTSGTIRAVEKAVFYGYDGEFVDEVELFGQCKRDWLFSREELRKVTERLCGGNGSEDERIRRERFFDRRSEFIVAGAVLLEEIFDLLEIKEMEVSVYALGEGVIAEALANVFDGYDLNANARWGSVMRLAARFSSKKRMNFAAQCAGIARVIFEGLRNCNEVMKNQTKLAAPLDGKDLEYLEAACLLHNVGLFTGKKGYHKLSYGIIKNGDHLFGYNDEEIELISLLARYHRKKIPKIERAPFKHFAEEVRQKFSILCAIIRTSVVLQQTYRTNFQRLEFLHCHEGFKLVLKEVKDGDPLHYNVHPSADENYAELMKEIEYFKMVLQQDILVGIPACN